MPLSHKKFGFVPYKVEYLRAFNHIFLWQDPTFNETMYNDDWELREILSVGRYLLAIKQAMAEMLHSTDKENILQVMEKMNHLSLNGNKRFSRLWKKTPHTKTTTKQFFIGYMKIYLDHKTFCCYTKNAIYQYPLVERSYDKQGAGPKKGER